MKVLLYGRLAEGIGREADVDESGSCTIAQLRGQLAVRHPGSADSLARSRAFVGDRLVGDAHVVSARDRVEFLPPVSGG